MKRLAFLIVLVLGASHLTRHPATCCTPLVESPGPQGVQVVNTVEFSPRSGELPRWFLVAEPGRSATVGPQGDRVVKGHLSVTKDRARRDARAQLAEVVADWLRPDVPPSWKAPDSLIDGMIRDSHVTPTFHDLGAADLKDYETMYVAAFRADFSSTTRDRLLQAYHEDVYIHRISIIGGILAFILACLAALAGYIRTDEATKGYYTNPLRVLAAIGAGAAGAAIYHVLA